MAAHQGHRELSQLDRSVIIRAKPRRPAVRLMRMKNELRAAAGAAVTALLIAGCGSNPVPPPVIAHGVAAREPLMNPRPYGTADAALGLDVLSAWCQADPQANLVLSPSSLASGLGMAYLGARGGTARAMAGVLHLPAAGGQALEAGLQARSAALRHLDGPGVTLDASDQVWADPGLATRRTARAALPARGLQSAAGSLRGRRAGCVGTGRGNRSIRGLMICGSGVHQTLPGVPIYPGKRGMPRFGGVGPGFPGAVVPGGPECPRLPGRRAPGPVVRQARSCARPGRRQARSGARPGPAPGPVRRQDRALSGAWPARRTGRGPSRTPAVQEGRVLGRDVGPEHGVQVH